MKATWDPEADAAYFTLSRKRPYDGEEIAPGVILHYSKDDTIVGIEFIYFSRNFDRYKLVDHLWANAKEKVVPKLTVNARKSGRSARKTRVRPTAD